MSLYSNYYCELIYTILQDLRGRDERATLGFSFFRSAFTPDHGLFPETTQTSPARLYLGDGGLMLMPWHHW